MLQAFACPNCGASLRYTGAQAYVQCSYCRSSVVLPVPAAFSGNDSQLPDPSLSEVAILFRAGKRVQATIRYREITGASLQEAHDALDAFAVGGALRRPNRMGV